MTIQPADLHGRPGPTYRALADAFAEAIEGGRLADGVRLPPQRDLAHRLDVTVGTVGRAYDLLAQRGLTRGEVGRGTYVLARTEPLRVADGGSDIEGLIDLTSNCPARHRAEAAVWLGRLGVVAEPERIVLTNGAEGALTSVLLALARPGDAVL